MFVAGRQVPALDGATEPVLNPATGEVIATVALGSSRDVDRAVDAASDAFGAWADTPPAERARALLSLADRLEENAEEFAQLESMNVGKPISIAREEVPFAADNLRFFAGAARTLEGRAANEFVKGRTSIIRRDPLGVVGSVSPWNFPLVMAGWKIAPALMAGNTLVLKPSELTPMTTLRLAELAGDLFPSGVFNVVTGHGDTVGAALVSHPKVRMSSLTGDVLTGKKVLEAATGNLKRVHLELGGKAPVIVHEDADLTLAVTKIAGGAFGNSGQDCMAATRVYAAASIYEELVDRLAQAAEAVVVGDPSDTATEMGPVISQKQRDRIKGFVDRAVADGAKMVVGGDADGPGFWYRPTVLVGMQQGDEIIQKEVFGPVVTVMPFTSESEAIALANDVEYGLAASIFTSSVRTAMSAVRVLQFGTVWINEHMPVTSEMPHGGFKQSGQGNDMSVYALEEYTEIKHVMINLEEG
jgi:betaine-aldehyde dehydrogenase/aminobutyraldehyde dehydrogenase